jgi:hypothetical protein
VELVFIAVIIKNINSLSHRKLSTRQPASQHRTPVGYNSRRFGRRCIVFGVTDFMGFAHLFVFKNNGNRSTEHYVWGDRIGPLNVVFCHYFFSFISLLVSEESEAFSSCNFLNPSSALCIRSKFSPEHHLPQHPQSLLLLYHRTPGFTVT